MKLYSAKETSEYIAALQQDDLWFVGQRKWSAALTKSILKHEKELRNSSTAVLPEPSELGLVFLKSINQLSEEFLAGFNRIYLFNNTLQLHIIASEDAVNSFFIAKTQDCCNAMEQLHPLHIEAAKDQSSPHPYLFASLLGAIPNDHIPIKHCSMHNTWRFYHE